MILSFLVLCIIAALLLHHMHVMEPASWDSEIEACKALGKARGADEVRWSPSNDPRCQLIFRQP